MKTSQLKLFVSESVGEVSGELTSGDKPTAIMALAHGAGAGMNHPFMKSLAESLADLGIATLRFNFPFAEQKKNRPDFPAVAHKTIESALNKAHELFPKLPVFAAGKSFGGRMSSQYLSATSPDFVKGIIFFGFPLHAPGKATIERAEHLNGVKVPMLFLQGTRDALAEWNLIEQVTKGHPKATLIKIEGADHSFKKGKENLIPFLANETIVFIKKIIK
ncbi:MAG TPA: alpha/beta family hydrolase [Cyclobacteriaceae bacterium]|nr:alpha/beta family hydrolase [Cyclobacteriaceae bacterium]